MNENELLSKAKNEGMEGSISRLPDGVIELVYSGIIEEDKFRSNVKITKVEETHMTFPTVGDIMNYLRKVRFDHALNFELGKLAEPLLGELYKNKKIDVFDILGA